MSTPRRPLSNTTGPNSSPRRNPNENSPGRPPSATTVPPSAIGAGFARNPSLRRPNRRSTARMSTSLADVDIDQDEDEKLANTQLMSELKESLQRVEQANEQYRKQLDAMKARLDDATNQLTVAEEKEFQRQTELDHLNAQMKDTARQRRELEMAHESETRLMMQGQQALIARENEMQNTIARLNTILREKGLEKALANRAASMPTSTSQEDDNPPVPGANNDANSAMLREKDAMIESLRLELAEIEFNAAEQGHVGEGRFQELEKQLVEVKLQNGRLADENETFQLLLSEKTLKGDFAPEHQETSGLNSLAEELESFSDDPEAQNEAYKKLEAENKQLKESSKALTLYIDKIIGRILMHEGFEHIIVDKDDKDSSPPPPPPAKAATFSSTDKALPPPPGQDTTAAVQNAAAGFLQRARSVVSRTGKPTRPMSYAQPNATPTANENPETAPSIPLNRGHRRARSDQAQQDLGAAAVVQQMNRGSPLRTVSGGPMSPGISPISPQLAAKPGYFPALSQASTRAPSGTQQGGGRGSSRNSVTSDHSQERSSTDASSAHAPPPSTQSAQSAGPNIPGAVMKQSQLRPLRLVQAQSNEDEEARKRANRGSWMGWLRGSALEANNDETMK